MATETDTFPREMVEQLLLSVRMVTSDVLDELDYDGSLDIDEIVSALQSARATLDETIATIAAWDRVTA